MSVRWQTFNFKKLLTKYPIIPTACHLLHSPHPIPGAASRRPPVEYSKAGTSKFCFFMLESGEESVVKRQPVIWIWFRVSYTKSRGLLSRIIIKIIQRISPVSKITGYLFTYGLFAAFSS